jgi:ABC-type glycerol-3-phosphate transport system substrate-binding protein
MNSSRSSFKSVAAAAVAAVALLAVAACGDKGTGGGEATDAPTDPTEVTGTVTWWGWTPDQTVAARLIEEFNKVYPGVTVNFKNFNSYEYKAALVPALGSNEGPDVFNMAGGGDTAEIQVFGEFGRDLTPLAERTLGAAWKEKINSTYLDQLTRDDGTVVSLPYAGVAAGFAWVNQDILDGRALAYPDTYDGWVDVCRTLKADGVTCFTFGAARGDSTIIEVARPIANTVDPSFFMGALQGERTWDDPAWVETLGLMKKMMDDGILAEDILGIFTYPDSNNAFMAGDALMIATGTWYAQYAVRASALGSMEGAGITGEEPFTMLPQSYPDVAGKGNPANWFGEVDYGLSINAKSKNVAAAEALVSWLTLSDEGQQLVVNGLDVVPVLNDFGPAWDSIELVDQEVQQPAIADMMAKAAALTESRQALLSAEMINEIFNCIVSVLDGSAAPEAAAKTLQDAIG